MTAYLGLRRDRWSDAYLKDVLTRLPTQRASEIEQLLPHQWVAAETT